MNSKLKANTDAERAEFSTEKHKSGRWIARFFFSILFLALTLGFSTLLHGQATAYQGKRLAVYRIALTKVEHQGVDLSCTLVNTGREKVQFPRDVENTVLEWDELEVPDILKGHEKSISTALKELKFDLDPDEIQKNQSFHVSALAAPEDDGNLNSGLCGDLVFDTAYLVEYNTEFMRVRYQISNAGAKAVNLQPKQSEGIPKTSINVYFVSGTRITRGAFQAGTSYLEKGKETLDGWLRPGQSLYGEIIFGLENRTKFAQNLVLELDPLLISNECKRTNNTYAIIVDF
ncbi:MAG: hypothetical protein IT269_11150 [Saprospiraceae bacterium]|nr:hypothetical protein [Saprospiraceae bacterium]